MRHVWGAASREIPPAHPNHNLDGFRVLLKTLQGFVFTLRPTCLWRARSASLQQLRGLCSAGGARSTSFGDFLGELFRLRLPLETLLNLLKLWLLLEALAQPPSKKLLRLLPLEALAQPLPLEALAQPPLESSSGCLLELSLLLEALAQFA